MNDKLIDIPDEWLVLSQQDLRGSIMILGQSDTGKSTLARFLFEQALERNGPAAYIDADLGQQILGPPGAISVAVANDKDRTALPPLESSRMCFVGNTTPRGHFVQLLLGLHKLQEHAVAQGALTTIVDTSGFINPMQGAAVLKWAKVDLLKPGLVIAMQSEREMEPILAPLRRLMGERLRVLSPSQEVGQRTTEERQAHRAQRYQEYFQQAQQVQLSYRRLAVFPQRSFTPGQLLALNDESGFALALAVIEQVEEAKQALSIRTPWWGAGKVASLYLGALKLNLESFYDEPL